MSCSTAVNIVVRDALLSKESWAGAFSRSVPSPSAGIFASFCFLFSLLYIAWHIETFNV